MTPDNAKVEAALMTLAEVMMDMQARAWEPSEASEVHMWAGKLAYVSATLTAALAETSVLRIERDHARARFERATKILAGIHAVIYPRIVKLNDGRSFAFNSPTLHEQMQALSDRIRAIPDEIAAMQGESHD